MGDTLDVNQISIDEAMSGKVKRASQLPAILPEPVSAVSTEQK
jgi:hypothetical protein